MIVLTGLCLCRDSFYSGFMLSRAKRSKLNIVSMDLLVYQGGGSSGIIYPSSEGILHCSQLCMLPVHSMLSPRMHMQGDCLSG